MVQFEYDVSLTDGVGEWCPDVGFAGTMPANSIYHVRDFCVRMMGAVPGVYAIRIRNVKESDWVEFDPVDTRNG